MEPAFLPGNGSSSRLLSIVQFSHKRISGYCVRVGHLRRSSGWKRPLPSRPIRFVVYRSGAKPHLKDVDYFFSPAEKGDFSKKIIFTIITKNFGQRPAYNLNPSIFFIKKSDNKIESHGSVRPPAYESYQNVLYPGESKSYKVTTNFSSNGLSDLNSLVAVIRYKYFDKALHQSDSVTFFYEHSVNGTLIV